MNGSVVHNGSHNRYGTDIVIGSHCYYDTFAANDSLNYFGANAVRGSFTFIDTVK